MGGMSVFKPNGSKFWYYRFVFRGREYKASTKTKNKEAAGNIERTLRINLAQSAVGIVIPEEAPKLEDFIPTFLAHVKRTRKTKTATFYGEQCRRLLEVPTLKTARLTEIDTKAVRAFALHRAKKVSPATVNRALATIRRILSFARQSGIPAADPRIELLKGERQREFVLAEADEDRYIAALRADGKAVLADIAILILETGLRITEVLTLECRDVRAGVVTVRPVNAKSGKARSVPLTVEAMEIVKPRLGADHRLFREAPTLWCLDRWHREIRTDLKLPGEFVIHSLRHTALTRMGESGMDTFTLQAIAGHRSITTTQRYVHPQARAIRDAMTKFEAQRVVRNSDQATNGVVVPIRRK